MNSKADPPLGSLFDVGARVAEYLRSRVTNLDADTTEQHVFKAVQFFFFCKALKTYLAIILLWREGYNEDAWILVRSLLEARMQSKYISTDGERLARQFVDHDAVSKMDWYSKVKASDFTDLIEQLEKDKSSLDEVRDRYRAASDRTGGQYWWKHGFEWLARETDLEKDFLMVYTKCAGFAHSGPATLGIYLRGSDDAVVAHCYPSDETDDMVPLWATTFVIGIAEEAGKSLGVDMQPAIDRAVLDYKRITGA